MLAVVAGAAGAAVAVVVVCVVVVVAVAQGGCPPSNVSSFGVEVSGCDVVALAGAGVQTRSVVFVGAVVSVKSLPHSVYAWQTRSETAVASAFSNSTPSTHTVVAVHSRSLTSVCSRLSNSAAVHTVRGVHAQSTCILLETTNSFIASPNIPR